MPKIKRNQKIEMYSDWKTGVYTDVSVFAAQYKIPVALAERIIKEGIMRSA